MTFLKSYLLQLCPSIRSNTYAYKHTVNEANNINHELTLHASHKPLDPRRGCCDPPLCAKEEKKKKSHAARRRGPRRLGFSTLSAKSNGVLLPPARLSLFINTQPAPTSPAALILIWNTERLCISFHSQACRCHSKRGHERFSSGLICRP